MTNTTEGDSHIALDSQDFPPYVQSIYEESLGKSST